MGCLIFKTTRVKVKTWKVLKFGGWSLQLYTLPGTILSHPKTLLKMFLLFQRWNMLVPRRVCFPILFLELQVPAFFCSVHARESATYQWFSRCRGSEPFCEHCQGWLGVSLDGQLFVYWIVWGKRLTKYMSVDPKICWCCCLSLFLLNVL